MKRVIVAVAIVVALGAAFVRPYGPPGSVDGVAIGQCVGVTFAGSEAHGPWVGCDQ